MDHRCLALCASVDKACAPHVRVRDLDSVAVGILDRLEDGYLRRASAGHLDALAHVHRQTKTTAFFVSIAQPDTVSYRLACTPRNHTTRMNARTRMHACSARTRAPVWGACVGVCARAFARAGMIHKAPVIYHLLFIRADDAAASSFDGFRADDVVDNGIYFGIVEDARCPASSGSKVGYEPVLLLR